MGSLDARSVEVRALVTCVAPPRSDVSSAAEANVNGACKDRFVDFFDASDYDFLGTPASEEGTRHRLDGRYRVHPAGAALDVPLLIRVSGQAGHRHRACAELPRSGDS